MNLDEENINLKKAINYAFEEQVKKTIGVQSEHTLHRVFKFYLSNDVTNHEILVEKMYADVVINHQIYEVQTKNFNLLRNKLDRFLINYDVTIVYPLAVNKNIYLFNHNQELLKSFKSPKHMKLFDVMNELYKIKNYLLDKHLHLKIIMVDLDEYRIERNKNYHNHKGFERVNQIPRKINNIYDFNCLNEFKAELLKYNLPQVFDSKTFAKICKINIKTARVSLNILKYLDVIENIGKNKNSYLYQINRN